MSPLSGRHVSTLRVLARTPNHTVDLPSRASGTPRSPVFTYL